MSEVNAIELARGFQKIDRCNYKRAAKSVESLIEEGYTPEEALMLTGIGGYEN